MSTIERRHGVVIELPEAMAATSLDESSPAAATFRRRRASGGPVPMPDAGVATRRRRARDDGTVEQDMSLLDSFVLNAVSAPGAVRRGGEAHARVSVELTDHEDAVLLLEQVGVYAWRHANGDATTRIPERRQGALVVPGRKRLGFELAVAPLAYAVYGHPHAVVRFET